MRTAADEKDGSEAVPLDRVQQGLARVLTALVFRDNPGAVYGEVPISQLKCLRIIGEAEGLKMNELAQRMEVKLPAVSQIVERLVRRGLVERRADSSDRRVVRLELTDTARAKSTEMKSKRDARMAVTLDRLSERDLNAVIGGLDLLAAAAEQSMELERSHRQESASHGVLSPTDPRSK